MARRRGTNTGIPGLSFSWKRALGISRARHRISRKIGIPTTRSGRQQKLGRMITGGGCLISVLTVLLSIIFIALMIV